MGIDLTNEKFQMEERLVIVASEYLQGKSQTQIAEQVGVTQQQVSNYLKKIRQEWLDSRSNDLDELRAMELAKIDELERVHWVGYHRSLQTQTKRSRTELSSQVNGTRTPIMNKLNVVEEQGKAELGHLKGIEWCISQRIILLGLDQLSHSNSESIRPQFNVYMHSEVTDGYILNETAD